ncbi:MAG: DUF1285 domain-containing protein [Deltaproteobacteria bacterium]|nr:DUF1285 domain-containing protein [Deltaproteobacteria bacterium]
MSANPPLAGRFVIEPDGAWHHNDEEITHERTWKLFSTALRRLADGRYVLAIGNERVYVEVMDAPLVVTALRVEDSRVRLRFHDDTYHVLDPRTIRFLGNVPYCDGRDGLPAKFSIAAYHQLAEHIHETDAGFELRLGDAAFALPPQTA